MAEDRKVAEEKKPLKKYGVTYQKYRIRFPYPRNPRRGICDNKRCKRRVGKEINTTQLHHHFYAYELKTVKKNPILALDNTNEFCFNPCHKAADALRMLTMEIKPQNYDKVIGVIELLPSDMQANFTKLCKMWLKEERNNGRR